MSDAKTKRWQFDETADVVFIELDGGKSDEDIAHVVSGEPRDGYLITAAPDLLAALKAAEHAISSADFFKALSWNPHTREMCERALVEARAAIARAEGRS